MNKAIVYVKKLDRQNSYNSLAFLATAMIPLIDQLVDTNRPKQNLKRHIKGMLKECEKLSDEKFRAFQNADAVPDENGKTHDMEDLMNITDEAYANLVEIINLKANEVVSLTSLYNRIKQEDINLEDVLTEYKPIRK